MRMRKEDPIDREARLNRRARRNANIANQEVDRVRRLFDAGKADIHELRAAQRDAFYWNDIVNHINGWI